MHDKDRHSRIPGASPNDPSGTAPRSARSHDAEHPDLAIEKRWLQLTRIDPDEFAPLYRKYRPGVHRYFLIHTRDEDRASDLADETFSRVLDKLPGFRWQGYSFGAWVFRFAANVLREERRRRRNRPEVPFDAVRHDRPDAAARPDADLDRKDDRHLLGDALATLAPERRDVFVNHYGLGMTTREVAVVMSLPEGTVKSHLQRGRRQLRRHLREHGMERGLSARGRRAVVGETARDEGWSVVQEGSDAPPPDEAGDRAVKGGEDDA